MSLESAYKALEVSESRTTVMGVLWRATRQMTSAGMVLKMS
jgi:hypothetical protein